jgi:hypothetical protein
MAQSPVGALTLRLLSSPKKNRVFVSRRRGEMADTLVLEASGETRGGSSPSGGTLFYPSRF